MNGGKTGEAGQLFQSALSVVVTRTTRPRIWPRSAASLPVGGRHSSTAGPPGGRAAASASLPGSRIGANESSVCTAAVFRCAGPAVASTAGSTRRNEWKWAACSISRGRESVNGLNAGSAARSDSGVN